MPFHANVAAPRLAGTVPAAPTARPAACLVWRPSRLATGLVWLAWRRVWSSRSVWIWWRRAWRHVRRRLQVCLHSVLQGGQLRPSHPLPLPTTPLLPPATLSIPCASFRSQYGIKGKSAVQCVSQSMAGMDMDQCDGFMKELKI